jgi:transposase
MAIDRKHLPEDAKTLQQMVLDLMAQLDREFSERSKIEALLHELLDAKRNRKSEQLSDEQLALFATLWQQRQTEREAENPAEEDDDDQRGKPGANTTSTKKRGGRQALPRHLKRERIVHDLAQEEKHCGRCNQDLRPIGEETCERYEYVPASLTVIEEACLKYACACTVRTAGKPPQPIEKSIAGASLLAHVIVSKMADHLPLHRQERMFERHGIDISRKSMCGWLAQSAGLLNPLYLAAKKVLFESKSHWHRRHRRESAGPEATLRPHRAHLALLRRCRSSSDCLRLHTDSGAGRTREVPGRISRLSTSGRLRRI